MNYRNRKLLDAIHDAPNCFICFCHGDGDNIVPAHSNQLRDAKGMGIKSHDYRVAALCNKCHMELDQGKTWTKEQRRDVWEEAHRETIGWLFDSGRLVLAK